MPKSYETFKKHYQADINKHKGTFNRYALSPPLIPLNQFYYEISFKR